MHSEQAGQRNAWQSWGWILLAAVVWALLPTVIGQGIAPDNSVLIGTSELNPTDAAVYQSYIEQGREGSWWMHDWFTSEITLPTLWQPHWFVIGRLGEWLSIETPTTYILSRLAGAAALSGAMWWSAGWVFGSGRRRLWISLLTLFGGGVGWIWTLVTSPAQPVTSSPDIWVAEMYPALSLLTSPHFLFVTAAFLVTLVAVERFAESKKTLDLVMAALAGLIVLALHPFHVVTWLVLWLSLTVVRFVQRENPWRYIVGWGTTLLCASPVLVLYGLQIWTDELTRLRAEQNIATTWQWPATILALGIFGVMALWSRRDQWSHPAKWRWLAAWAIVGVAVLFLPLSFQRRLSQGLIIPFIWLSVPVIEKVAQKVKRTWIVAGLVVVFGCVSSAYALSLVIVGYVKEASGENRYNFYLFPEQQAVYRAIRQDPNPDHAVLGSVTSSQFVPSQSKHRVFIGHSVETLHFSQKLEQLRKFYSAASAIEQRTFITRNNICWIIDGPRERAYGSAFVPSTWPELQLIRETPNLNLYYFTECT